ncbi:hypothetical protein ABZP36_009426 [Zizania latifolia]
MAASSSIEEKQDEMLKVLEAFRGRIRKQLLETGRVTHERERHCLAFMEMEVSALVESRRLPPPPPWTDCDGVNSFLEEWLNNIDGFVDRHGGGQVGHSLLQKVARPFRRRKLISHLLREIEWNAYQLYRAAEECCGYELPCSDLRPPPPPQAAKECDLVGIDGPAKKLLRWLTAAAAADNKSLESCASSELPAWERRLLPWRSTVDSGAKLHSISSAALQPASPGAQIGADFFSKVSSRSS